MGYRPIGSCGVIGDMRSIALVGGDGEIDWCCLPRFDSPSLFAALLDERKGGAFRLASSEPATSRQMYVPDTNVLLTRFLSADSGGEVCDFMPIAGDDGEERGVRIIRIARATRGQARFRLECRPAFDYARRAHQVTLHPCGALFDSSGGTLGLLSPVPLTIVRDGGEAGVAADFVLCEGESRAFALLHDDNPAAGASLLEQPIDAAVMCNQTVAYWRRWSSQSTYTGRWRELVQRSALVLKLLTFAPTGAIVAAPTCSLPEVIGGQRNWDYRYTWIRDAAFTLHAFLRLGYTAEADRFLDWLSARLREPEGPHGPLQPVYGIDGRHALPEETLDHLDGYRGSRPVRIGNGAAAQLQLDVYGEILNAMHRFDARAQPLSYERWQDVQRLAGWVAKHWQTRDAGIWEIRHAPQHFVYSKVQCWVALDRALRLSAKRSLPLDREELARVRDRIHDQIMRRGYDVERGTFVQFFGASALDASNLIMPLVRFIAATDPRMLGTLDRMLAELASDDLVHRYQPCSENSDHLGEREGTFSICTFWLVEALARAGRLEQARFIFEKMLTNANHLSLFAEKIGPHGEAIGNFPQAFTHLGLIRAALGLDRALDRQHGTHRRARLRGQAPPR